MTYASIKNDHGGDANERPRQPHRNTIRNRLSRRAPAKGAAASAGALGLGFGQALAGLGIAHGLLLANAERDLAT